MYQPLRNFALGILRAPREAPDPPAGSHGSIQIFRASPRYLSYRLLGFWIGIGVLAVVLSILFVAGLASDEWGLAVLAVVIPIVLGPLLFLGYFAVRIDYEMRYYIVTDRSLRVREGAWTVKEMTLTYANVQNLRVAQGPIQRAFGIWSLMVDTAGGGGGGREGQGDSSHQVDMAGIENAHEVRDIVLGHLRARGGGGTGLGDPDDPDGSPKRVAVSPEVVAAVRELRDAAAGLRRAASASV